MQNLTDCLLNTKLTTPQSYYFVILVSPDFSKHYKMQILAIKLYCRIHGYRLKIIDPLPYFHSQDPEIERYVDLKLTKVYSTAARPVIMREIFREAYEKSGCDVKWVIFLDADVFIVDFARPIESLVQFIDNNHMASLRVESNKSLNRSLGIFSGASGASGASVEGGSRDSTRGTGMGATSSHQPKRFHCKVVPLSPLWPS